MAHPDEDFWRKRYDKTAGKDTYRHDDALVTPNPNYRCDLETAIYSLEISTNMSETTKWEDLVAVVCAAARKHLATLPKPEPKFRVVGVRRRDSRRYTGQDRFSSRDEADRAAATWMEHGAYNSVAVEQVSA